MSMIQTWACSVSKRIVVVQIMDLSAISWSTLRYTAEDISHHSLPVIVRQRLLATSQRQVSDPRTRAIETVSQNISR